ncbi:hypothetical protein B0T21DRAFT_415753 [Apiosordaria backusii]|uniref:Uncharacterized protein n=1 Tax=Apiosordaria backusii TaxID=314023 RepID=A0AA40AAC2_9PEZI|nr:hypothetical protein B0T21DRAFT_415753 [Apiosordaria backusii]
MSSHSRSPLPSPESLDWEDAPISETGDWASDYYTDSDSEEWTCSDSDAASTTSTKDKAEAAVEEQIAAMMDAGAINSQVVETVGEAETATVESEAPASAAAIKRPPVTPAPQHRQYSRPPVYLEPNWTPPATPAPMPVRTQPVSPPAPATSPSPVPAPTPLAGPRPQQPQATTQPPKPLSPISRTLIAKGYYTSLTNLESSLAAELSTLPPVHPATPPSPGVFVNLYRLLLYNQAYRAADNADRQNRQNHNLPQRGFFTRAFGWFFGGGLSGFDNEVPHPLLMWEEYQAQIDYASVLEERNRKEKEIRERYEKVRVEMRRGYVRLLNGGVDLDEGGRGGHWRDIVGI